MKAAVAFFLCAAAVMVPQFAAGQVAPSASGAGRPSANIYALFTAGRPNYGQNWLIGATEGASLQWRRFIGVDGRLTELRWGPSSFHQYFATIGPRAEFRTGRLTEYGAVEGGLAHVRYPAGVSPSGVAHAADALMAPAWMADAGVDYRINRRLQIRAVDFQYSTVYVLNNLNPKLLSAGLVWRLF